MEKQIIADTWGIYDESMSPRVDYRVADKFIDSGEGVEGGSQWEEASVAIATIGPEVIYDAGVYERLSRIEENIREVKAMLQENLRQETVIIPVQIYSLPSEKYKLRAPVDVILEIHADEALALLPELTLCGEGGNQLEAIDDLKTDIVDLLEDLEGIPEADLGEAPKLWKRSLGLMVKRCQ